MGRFHASREWCEQDLCQKIFIRQINGLTSHCGVFCKSYSRWGVSSSAFPRGDLYRLSRKTPCFQRRAPWRPLRKLANTCCMSLKQGWLALILVSLIGLLMGLPVGMKRDDRLALPLAALVLHGSVLLGLLAMARGLAGLR